MSFLIIDPASGVAPFEQVRSQLAEAIHTGTLKPQDQLPTVRKLAADLGLAANTVARAYRELELIGIIETRGRNGTFVTGELSPHKAAGARLAATLAQRMRDLGMAMPRCWRFFATRSMVTVVAALRGFAPRHDGRRCSQPSVSQDVRTRERGRDLRRRPSDHLRNLSQQEMDDARPTTRS